MDTHWTKVSKTTTINLLHGHSADFSISNQLLGDLFTGIINLSYITGLAIGYHPIGTVSLGFQVTLKLDGFGQELSAKPLDQVVLLDPVEKRVEEYANRNQPKVPYFHYTRLYATN